MRKIDRDGLLLCELQAKTFENSAESTEMSSEIFIRRFMNSNVASLMDSTDFLQTNIQEKDIMERIEEEYGHSKYGSVKYSKNELYWIGYIYRYYSYTYELSSAQVYRIVKPKELRGLFLPYHTMDPAQAIERILEAKNLLMDEDAELQRQFEIFKKVREH
ncbi:MAG: antitoxin [Lachnospiraceae bacterium]|nr:antitoxin [Lachnospiraceae bacterium]